MRVLILAAIAALAPVAAAHAQVITIEDDVSRENAVTCAALRSLQFEDDKRMRGSILLSLAVTQSAWAAYIDAQPHYGDRNKLHADMQTKIAALRADPRYADDPKTFLRQAVSACEPFEIRSAS